MPLTYEQSFLLSKFVLKALVCVSSYTWAARSIFDFLSATISDIRAEFYLDYQRSSHWMISPWISQCEKVGVLNRKFSYEKINFTYLDTVYHDIDSLALSLQWATSFPIFCFYSVLYKVHQTHWYNEMFIEPYGTYNIAVNKKNVNEQNKSYLDMSRFITRAFPQHIAWWVFRNILSQNNTEFLTRNL